MNSSFQSDFDEDQLRFHPELRRAALAALLQTDCAAKQSAVATLWQQWRAGNLLLDRAGQLHAPENVPGRPPRPQLVSPLAVKSRSMRTAEGRAVLIHALAHIEFNAINLALDAIWRFPQLPDAFYADWLQVAQEEAYHFSLLAGHLQTLGFTYGDFPAHNSLWDMAQKTQADVLARIALVPRTMEARGLDAVPAVRAKLAQAGDQAAADILDIILHDEVGHVAIGNRWYAWLCDQRGVDTITTFADLVLRYKAPVMRGPFNFDARRAAGFTEEELRLISAG